MSQDQDRDRNPGARELCRACRRMARAGLIAGRSGNLSLRLGEHVLITPRGLNKARLRPSQVVVAPLSAPAAEVERASVEYAMHRACYLAADIGAVVHTHAPALTALGLLGLDLASIPEADTNVGGVALVPFQPSGSEALAQAVARAAAGRSGVLLLQGHGVVTVGRDLDEASDRMELAELAARAIVMARAAAGPPPPPRPPRRFEV